ncbi:hypothetical protein SAICODRAFT_29637 [Saitoella complicata NRRL Y-17804]|uniref:uncharacterized protein n=1 Tax=Saitoella complicata (strain BCRC 22490 / CBS 7301 / JCM 7358 / NBRC 10748 / NRRL Y-17804) TaxID=698492 RepID=UPI0008678C15|nr:uncharacterized protein SAICODRAFT_29637 [Saitoella complicata NRRL Y-17804]ODQ54030.1 hypothetical protein SAICODRAFT_29637 [Saitoella complicata NRRL Y-17804]
MLHKAAGEIGHHEMCQPFPFPHPPRPSYALSSMHFANRPKSPGIHSQQPEKSAVAISQRTNVQRETKLTAYNPAGTVPPPANSSTVTLLLSIHGVQKPWNSTVRCRFHSNWPSTSNAGIS